MTYIYENPTVNSRNRSISRKQWQPLRYPGFLPLVFNYVSSSRTSLIKPQMSLILPRTRRLMAIAPASLSTSIFDGKYVVIPSWSSSLSGCLWYVEALVLYKLDVSLWLNDAFVCYDCLIDFSSCFSFLFQVCDIINSFCWMNQGKNTNPHFL